MTRRLLELGRLALALALACGLCTALSCGDKSPGSAAAPRAASDDAPRSVSGEKAEPTPMLGPAGCSLPLLGSRYPAAVRIVAIGDLHGDLAATRAALRAGGLIDTDGQWVGGKTVLVQTGDQLDRGDDEQAILDLLETLRGQAARAGGAVHVLNGNHETMNASGDFRYVTPGGWADFQDTKLPSRVPGLAQIPALRRGRVAAFMPGGPYARLLAGHNTVVIVGDTAFVHGGVTPAFARYGVARFNREIRCWLAGQTPPPQALRDASSPLWSRHYSTAPERCEMLEEALAALGVKRMVVGHTPQLARGANAACGGRVWRIDTGIAAHYGGPIEALEIRGDATRVLEATRP